MRFAITVVMLCLVGHCWTGPVGSPKRNMVPYAGDDSGENLPGNPGEDPGTQKPPGENPGEDPGNDPGTQEPPTDSTTVPTVPPTDPPTKVPTDPPTTTTTTLKPDDTTSTTTTTTLKPDDTTSTTTTTTLKPDDTTSTTTTTTTTTTLKPDDTTSTTTTTTLKPDDTTSTTTTTTLKPDDTTSTTTEPTVPPTEPPTTEPTVPPTEPPTTEPTVPPTEPPTTEPTTGKPGTDEPEKPQINWDQDGKVCIMATLVINMTVNYQKKDNSMATSELFQIPMEHLEGACAGSNYTNPDDGAIYQGPVLVSSWSWDGKERDSSWNRAIVQFTLKDKEFSLSSINSSIVLSNKALFPDAASSDAAVIVLADIGLTSEKNSSFTCSKTKKYDNDNGSLILDHASFEVGEDLGDSFNEKVTTCGGASAISMAITLLAAAFFSLKIVS